MALTKFAVTADYVIGAAAQSARVRNAELMTVADLQSGISDYGIVEDPSIWTVVETKAGFGLGAPVYGLGACGILVDPSWSTRPGVEVLLGRTECTGTSPQGSRQPPAPSTTTK